MSPRPLPAKPPNRRDLLTLAEVLAELEVSKSTFFKWRAVGKAPRSIKFPNGSIRVRRADLDAWLQSHTEERAA